MCFAISEIVVNGRCEIGNAGVGQLLSRQVDDKP